MAKVTKTIKRAVPTVVTSQSGAYAVGVVGVLGVLYLMSRESPSGETYIEKITERISEGVSETIVETVYAVGGGIVEIPEKVVKKTQEKTEERVEDVYPGITYGYDDLSYTEFMAKKPIITQTLVAIGNIETGGAAGQYGAYVGEETYKHAPEFVEKYYAPGTSKLMQTYLSASQALTVPFVEGGGAGLATRHKAWLSGLFSKKESSQ